jgi:hypothetical protein
MKMITKLAHLAVIFFIIAFLTSCASGKKTSSKHNPSGRVSQSDKISLEAQKKAYDAGLKYYSEEKYIEARKAWQDAIRFEPTTLLAKKSHEYLVKTEKILETLKEIDKQ